MHITFSTQKPTSVDADLLIIGAFEGAVDTPTIRQISAAIGGHLEEHRKDEEFEGAKGKTLAMHAHGKLPMKKLVLLGLGKPAEFSMEQLRRGAGQALKIAKGAKATKAALHLPFKKAGQADAALQVVIEGLLLADYEFKRYKSEPKDRKRREKRLEEIVILHDGLSSSALRTAEHRGTVFAEAARYAQDLVNTPALDMNPKTLAEEATKLAMSSGRRVSIKVYDREKLKAMGCGGVLAVAQGSVHEPYMLHLKYSPPTKARKRIVLVGKGVTFDSGGLSIKPADGMMDMKIDMGGAAAVLAVFKALPLLKPPVEVHGITALVENMPSGAAIRPGDIVKTMSGKTIEILNTDAEGRVTLADTLFYGSKLKPNAMIDLATLTGACIAALGTEVAGLMATDDRLADRLQKASDASGEMIWRLPLTQDYTELIKSRHADVKNITGSRAGGGVITAGLFLKEFVNGAPWAHLDIAGLAYNERDTADYRAWGASGFGARLLLEFLMSL